MPTATKSRPKEKKPARKRPQIKVVEDAPKAAAAPAEVKPATADAEKRLTELERLEEVVAQAEAVFEAKKQDAKAAKETFELRVCELRQAIRASKNDAERPLLANLEKTEDAWRKEPLTHVQGLTKTQRSGFEEAGVITLGDFEDSRAAKPGDWYAGIKGIGKGTSDAVLEKVLKLRDAAEKSASNGHAETVVSDAERTAAPAGAKDNSEGPKEVDSDGGPDGDAGEGDEE